MKTLYSVESIRVNCRFTSRVRVRVRVNSTINDYFDKILSPTLIYCTPLLPVVLIPNRLVILCTLPTVPHSILSLLLVYSLLRFMNFHC